PITGACMTRTRIVIAGGGTGGHVFPGLAIAAQLMKLADVEITFVGSPRGLEKDLVPARGFRLELLDVEPIKGGGVRRAVRGALGVPLRDGFDASPYRAGATARVLVLGGSQGARAINEAMPEAIAAVKKYLPHIEVIHQSGRGNDDDLRSRYDAAGVRADVRA